MLKLWINSADLGWDREGEREREGRKESCHQTETEEQEKNQADARGRGGRTKTSPPMNALLWVRELIYRVYVSN